MHFRLYRHTRFTLGKVKPHSLMHDSHVTLQRLKKKERKKERSSNVSTVPKQNMLISNSLLSDPIYKSDLVQYKIQ